VALTTASEDERLSIVELLQQEPRMLEADRRRAGELTMRFECIAEERSVFDGNVFAASLHGSLHQVKGAKHARQARRLELQLGVPSEERELPRRLASTTTQWRCGRVNLVRFAEAANAIVGEAGTRFDRARACLVSNHA
jgi:hypothetical protein